MLSPYQSRWAVSCIQDFTDSAIATRDDFVVDAILLFNAGAVATVTATGATAGDDGGGGGSDDGSDNDDGGGGSDDGGDDKGNFLLSTDNCRVITAVGSSSKGGDSIVKCK